MASLRAPALIIAATLTVAACGGGDDDTADPTVGTASAAGTATDGTAPDGTATASSTATSDVNGGGGTDEPACEATVPGTELNYGTFAPTAYLDPTYSSGALVGGAELAAIYDVLFRYEYETGEYIPQLAESITPNDDHTVWTLELQQGIEYSDGTPLTAQLVADNMDRFFAEGVRNPSAGFLTPIKNKQVVDDVTLKLTLQFPWVEFPYVFADEPGMIVNLNAIGNDPEAFAANPPPAAGLGPYVLERNAPNEEVVMTARDDYWGGPVCVETLRFTSPPGATSAYDAFKNDELNMAFLREPAVNAEAENAGENNLQVQQDNGLNVYINHEQGRPGADPRLRHAIALAVDPQIVNQRSYQGELNPGKSLVQEGSRFYSDGIEEFPVDAEQASQLVEEAKGEGFDGKVEILCQSEGPARDNSVALEGMLDAVGFDATAVNQPVSEVIGRMVAGNYDLVCSGLGAGPETGMTALMRALQSNSDGNRMGYKNPEMDAAILELFAAETPEAQKQAMVTLNDIFLEDAPFLPVGALDEMIIWKDDVKGLQTAVSSIVLFDDAYVEAS